MTASEQVIQSLHGLAEQARAIGPTALLLNLAVSLTIVAVAWAASLGLRRLVRSGVRRFPGPASAEKQVRGGRAIRVSTVIVNLVVGMTAVAAIATVWGVDIAAVLSSSVGSGATQIFLRATLVVVIAALALEAAGFLIGEALERLATRSDDPRRSAQLDSFGPLLRGVVQGAIVIVAALMLLGDLGVKIGPLLAGAGVVGIAVGFGAQTVVRDLLTGLFLLAEDIVAVGDVVRIGDSAGLVEAMTLRTIRLRDFDGTLHVFPYGEAQVVHNLTKTFSYYVFELQVSYTSDIDKALRIMRETGAEMQADANFSKRILEPIEVVGVESLADSGVVLKARIKTQPIQQWNVGREYNRRIKLAFDREGIEIPFPHLKLVLPEKQLQTLVRH